MQLRNCVSLTCNLEAQKQFSITVAKALMHDAVNGEVHCRVSSCKPGRNLKNLTYKSHEMMTNIGHDVNIRQYHCCYHLIKVNFNFHAIFIPKIVSSSSSLSALWF